MRIFKYRLGLQIHKPIDMPSGAAVLSVQMQHGEPVVWALVDPAAPPTKKHFRLVVTGEELTQRELADLKYVGTYQAEGGNFIGHVFEKIR
jgi:hypothetical protein